MSGLPRARLRAPIWRIALAWLRRRTITAITPKCQTCARYAGTMPDALIVMLHEAHTNADRWIQIAREAPRPHYVEASLARSNSPVQVPLPGPGTRVSK